MAVGYDLGVWWSSRRGKGSRHRLPLSVHVGLVLSVAVGAAYSLWWLWSGTWEFALSGELDDKTRLEIAKIVLAIVGGLGGVVFLTVRYRKQRDGENAEVREQVKHFHERFDAAAEQLGSDAPRVRLAGVYAMAALADDWDAGRQTCINVLCGYIRAPYEPPGELAVDATDEDRRVHAVATQEREVRRAILDTIGGRLREKPKSGRTWHGHTFDLNGAVIESADLTGVKIPAGTVLNFTRAMFPTGMVNFDLAELSGGLIDFTRARFCGGRVGFLSARFSKGDIRFSDARISGGEVVLFGAWFSGGLMVFDGVVISGGEVLFFRTEFTKGELSFFDAEFPGGRVDFRHSGFSGGLIDFTRARFSGGTVDFGGARFNGGRLKLTGIKDWSVPPRF